MYSDTIFADFTAEIYESFQKYSGEITPSARQIIGYMVDGDWLNSYSNPIWEAYFIVQYYLTLDRQYLSNG